MIGSWRSLTDIRAGQDGLIAVPIVCVLASGREASVSGCAGCRRDGVPLCVGLDRSHRCDREISQACCPKTGASMCLAGWERT
jgi:hypothetical protein